MSDLVEFLRARLDELEAKALRARDGERTMHVDADDDIVPLPRPADDPRFTVGLAIDVAGVLAEHGYPEIREGMDLLRLQEALFRFIYAD